MLSSTNFILKSDTLSYTHTEKCSRERGRGERELVLVWVKACPSNGLAPPMPYFLTSSNNIINSELGIQIHEPRIMLTKYILTKNTGRWHGTQIQKRNSIFSKSTENGAGRCLMLDRTMEEDQHVFTCGKRDHLFFRLQWTEIITWKLYKLYHYLAH